MEFADRLTDTELRSLYQKFAEAENIVRVKITRTPDDISLDGTVEVKLDTGQTIRTEDCYTLTDFDVVAHNHDGNILVNRIYREYMYGKFGEEYARTYLFRGL
jgi:hypothetical protein